MKNAVRALCLSLALVAAPAVIATAQDPAPATDPSEDRSATFRAVDGAASESVPGGPLLVGAYGAALALLVLYVVWLGMLQRGATREIARLEGAMEKHAKERKEPKATPAAESEKDEAAAS